MSKDKRKEMIENMAERFMQIDNLEEKSMAILCMSAYAEGKAAGKAEERKQWEQKTSSIATA